MAPKELKYQGKAARHTAFSFLATSVHGLKRGTLEHAFHKRLVFVNDQSAPPEQVLNPNDLVRLELAYSNKTQVHAEALPLDICFEDEHILIISKTRGMPCHHGLGHYKGHLLNALAYHYQQTGSDALETGLVQRLDKDTSGLMVVAKSQVAMQLLNGQIRNQQLHKSYLALVWGTPQPGQGIISVSIGRDPQDEYIIRTFENGQGGKPATTLYQVKETRGLISLVEIQTLTGRTHQIRIHMQHIGHALVGDMRYPNQSVVRSAESAFASPALRSPFLTRHLLHSSRLAFIHPVTREPLTFESSMPEDMRTIWECRE